MRERDGSFVVVCWNDASLIGDCLASIAEQADPQPPVFVVDNGSTDGSQDRIRANHPAVTLIEAETNLGFADANNLGIQVALADPACRYVALVNADARLERGWLDTLVAFADAHLDGAAFQGLTLDARDHDVVDSFGLTLNHAGKAIQLGYRRRGLRPPTGAVFGVNAAAALYSRSFLCTQPFGAEFLDADLFMYLEDVDLAARAVATGWKSYFVAGATAYHLGSGGGRENAPFSLRMTTRNELLVAVKNLPWSVVVRAMPRMIWADLARIRRFLQDGDYRAAATMLLGRAQSVPLLPRFLAKRRRLTPARTVGAGRIWELMGRFDPQTDGLASSPPEG